MNALPAEAETLVARIEALLAQAEPLAHGGGEEAAFALRETERRYLPDTVRSYLDIPPARRDATAATMLVEQLRLLERATAQRLAALSESAETALAANGAFLAERFGPADALPEPPSAATQGDAGSALEGSATIPAVMVRRLLERLDGGDGGDSGALVERAGTQLAAAFPTIVRVRRAGLFGRGPVEAVELDVPRRDDLLRYALVRVPHGVEATVTRFLRGIKNKTLAVGIDEWTRALIEDLSAY
ncbi:MAG: hypothetical protein JOZ24_07945, partial [Candidatus Eremiobacteraeota bacterium]|nr:hypothetical protein [Candidatus Eremiobacteraeota bacterium]